MKIFDWTLFKIRRAQLVWEIKNLGIFNLFYAGLISTLLFFIYQYSKTLNGAILVSIGLLFAVLSIHLNRKDSTFIHHHIEKPNKAIFWEYMPLYGLFILPVSFTVHWYFVPIYWLGIFAISFLSINASYRTRFSFLNQFIAPKHFEAISGLRQYLIPTSIIYALAWATCWVKGLPLFLLWTITAIGASFFTYAEPLHILRQTEKSPIGFLKHKACNYSKAMTILYSPIIILNFFMHPDLWFLQLPFLPIHLMLLVLAIFIKYANYRPNTDLRHIQTIMSINIFGGIIPFLMPLPIFFTVIYYFKAKNKLKYFLHD